MGVEELFDLPRVDVLTAPDNHVFQTASDLVVAVFVHLGKVAGVEPTLLVDGRCAGIGQVIVSKHDHGTAGLQLPLDTVADLLGSLGVDDTRLHAWQHLADGGHPAFDGVGGQCLGDGPESARSGP